MSSSTTGAAPFDSSSVPRSRSNPTRPENTHATSEPTDPGQPQRPKQRHYRPRTCRICLDTVLPTFDMDTSTAGAMFGARSRVKYVSEDPELGRLISPCKCKGSQRYVHEGCLRAWRLASPTSDRNYWSCPTCRFKYRMDRLRWSAWLTSRLARVGLTLVVVFVAIFLLGFVADPIINLWVDPFGTMMDAVSEVMDDFETPAYDDEPFTWSLHFLKGLFSLGLLGCVKAFLAMSPWQWFHVRTSGMLGGGGNRRRDRLESVNLALVIIGLFTFLAATWKAVSYLSTRTLEKVSESVLDIQGDDNDDDDDDQDEART